MKRKTLSQLLVSSAIMGSGMVGCTGSAFTDRVSDASSNLDALADAQARAAEKAIAARDAGKAVAISEAAVEANPQDAGYRTLLGRAYLLAGRYDSAKAAFADALTLGSTDARTIVNLALIRTSQGDNAGARALLQEHAAQLSPADYGLAMAMAGDADGAIRTLSAAIHDPEAGAKARQNLAYSYALAGKWVEARQTAMMDLPPLDAARRVASWAQYAQPGAESARVIAMIGVEPRGDDAGLPVRLALSKTNSDVALAQASPAPTPAPAPAAEFAAEAEAMPVAQIPAAPAAIPVELAKADVAPAAASPMPLYQGPMTAREAAPRPAAKIRPAALTRVAVPAAAFSRGFQPVDASRGSTWVVQLGAFSTEGAAKASWSHYARRYASVGAFPTVSSVANVNGRTFHRVAVAGFGDRAGADRLCADIRASGGSCFVRMGGSEAAPSRWAQSLRPVQLAMR